MSFKSAMLYQSSTEEGEFHLKVSPKGSTNYGGVWDDGFGGQVKQIYIWHGRLIHSIQTTYQRQGTNLVSRRHGGIGRIFDVVSLDEPLTWVRGHYESLRLDPELLLGEGEAPFNYCKVVTSLTFGTSRATYGPFGRETGEPFAFNSGTGISGFHGLSDDEDDGLLHAIGVYVYTMVNGLLDHPPVPAPDPPALENTEEKDVSRISKSLQMSGFGS